MVMLQELVKQRVTKTDPLTNDQQQIRLIMLIENLVGGPASVDDGVVNHLD